METLMEKYIWKVSSRRKTDNVLKDIILKDWRKFNMFHLQKIKIVKNIPVCNLRLKDAFNAKHGDIPKLFYMKLTFTVMNSTILVEKSDIRRCRWGWNTADRSIKRSHDCNYSFKWYISSIKIMAALIHISQCDEC